MATFAERLKHLREQAGLTQPELALKAGVPIGTLRDYEQGKRRTDPGFRTTVKLARAMGVDCLAFADCVDDEEPESAPAGRSRKAAVKPTRGKK